MVCVFNHPLQSQENKERKVNMSFCELKYAWITNNDAIIIASWNLLCSCVGDIAPDSSVSSSHSFENHAAINERNRLNAFNLFLKFYLKKKKKERERKVLKNISECLKKLIQSQNSLSFQYVMAIWALLDCRNSMR